MAKESLRRFTWGRPHRSRQPLMVKCQAVATVSGGSCSSIDSSLRDKARSIHAAARYSCTPVYVDQRTEPKLTCTRPLLGT